MIHKKLQLSSIPFIILYSVFTMLLYNIVFWQKIFQSFNSLSVDDVFFIFQILVILILLHIVLFSCFFVKFITKPLAIILLCGNALSTYFMLSYGFSIDSDMIRNVFHTDLKEASDLLNLSLLLYFFFLGIVPSFIIFYTTITYKKFLKELLKRSIIIIISFLLALALLGLNYREISTFIRTHKSSFDYLLPKNYIVSTVKLYKRTSQDPTIHSIGEDIKIQKPQDKTLVVVVVGETARKYNFSVLGYNKETNPLLKQHKDLIVLHNTTSCGTATAISLPCMFSHLDRKQFIDSKKQYEFLPSLLSRNNIDVEWYGNNFGGCKNVCRNVKYIDTQKLASKEHCNDSECLDGILIDLLEKKIQSHINKNTMIVLHQNGSHGPLYHKRYPKNFEKFKPVCNQANIRNCSKEELINAYDNTIVYTDYLLDKTIKLLKSVKIPSILIYMSDHGESLGEHNIYLHGFPYAFAPKEQKDIPFIVWMSPSFIKAKKINPQNLDRDAQYSHDNLFHAILNIFNANTALYKHSHNFLAKEKDTKH